MSELTDACGPHCGIMIVGKKKYVGHCKCSELCHGQKLPAKVLQSEPLQRLMERFGVIRGEDGVFVAKRKKEVEPYSAMKLTDEELADIEKLNGQPKRSQD